MPSWTTLISDRVEAQRDRTIVGNNRDNTLNGGRGNDTILGRGGDDSLDGRGGDDELFGESGDDTLSGEDGNDTLTGGLGDDVIFGGDGDDTVIAELSTDGADAAKLGAGSDAVIVSAAGSSQVRLTFTSSEVGNANANDSNTQANQDGGLAVRMQAEDGTGALTGPISRYDDESITFVAAEGLTFDVRDLVSGVSRGDHFEVVTLGTSSDDTLTALQPDRPYYFNGGGGNDSITGGTGMDFLVGGTGDDLLSAIDGDDSFIGGVGDDDIFGGSGDDTVIAELSTDGADAVKLGAGSDVVLVSAAGSSQVRLTFTSSEVGNANANDSNTQANQDGGLAVRIQAEDGSDGLTGPISRYDDESITFVAAEGLTFDVRDLVSGVSRGDHFEVVTLGTSVNDTLTAVQPDRPYYFNAGGGNDSVTGGTGMDFLVGGSGDDSLDGGAGDDSYIGGGGNDTIVDSGGGNDIANYHPPTDLADSVDLGEGTDVVSVTAAAGSQIRLTFTSSEVGSGSANDSNTQANQDGGLAVRFQSEDGSGALTGPVSRFDDEGIIFVASEGATFEVRDLVSDASRGDHFEVVTLGTSGADNLTAVQADRPYYFNAGMGNDTVTGGTGMDFLVGGADDDALNGGAGDDSYIGGGGNDTIVDDIGGDTVNFNVAADGADFVNLGDGSDVVSVSAVPGSQIRLTFTSSEVGNGSANDSNTQVGQDGGLAVRFQAEDGSDALTGPISRFDDEGITFVASDGATFDVRDLVSGASRGDHFEVVTLGTSGDDALTAVQVDRPYYFNAGGGNDTVTGGTGADFLVGGSGDDVLSSGKGDDTFIGGGGNDLLSGASGLDIFIFNSALDAVANVDEITDFSHLDDTIQLDDAVFAGLTPGALDPEAFALSTDAEEDDDRIVYNQSTGEVFFDSDGGTRDDLTLFATISNKPGDLAADDFLVI